MSTNSLRADLAGLDLRAIAQRERKAARGFGPGRLVVAAAAVAFWLTPFYVLLVASFKTTTEYTNTTMLQPPRSVWPIIDNAMEAWKVAGMGTAMLNSAIYGVVGAAAAVFIASLAAFGLSRIACIGRQGWFMLIFAGTLFPFQTFLIPLFFGFQKTGLINTREGMLLLYAVICVPFPTLVLKNYFAQIPLEMDEAARIEGCSEWRVFRSIVLPNARPALLAVFLLQFTWIWNDLLFASVLANGENVRSIMVALQVFQGAYVADGPNVILTGALVASLPTMALFLLLRRHFMAGLQLSAA
jgi:ABC-type glycerol-3-phosphate transport system permease component